MVRAGTREGGRCRRRRKFSEPLDSDTVRCQQTAERKSNSPSTDAMQMSKMRTALVVSIAARRGQLQLINCCWPEGLVRPEDA